MPTATYRFYEELNDFLAPARRRRSFSYSSSDTASAKHVIESLGVPHTEVELILLNGASVGFDAQVREGDRLAVYPKFEALDITPLLRVRERPLRRLRFVADAHLGGLARLLRLAGFDTLYDNAIHDARVERLAQAEHRVVLTRDRDLLMRSGVTHGCYVRALHPHAQLREVIARLDLARSARPFTLCLNCNARLMPIAKSEVEERLPPQVRRAHDRFATCPMCRRVYWEGSHWQRMRALVDSVLGARAA
ncbi:MAG TPA: Mut7-C RNAse domain-containing protein [Burkholderiaceae bacterium]|jgi:uncharacterized protein with PIN domain|nr:Mut7-C RNAse domain-containing protein [Burkholderiaceae bacterium]